MRTLTLSIQRMYLRGGASEWNVPNVHNIGHRIDPKKRTLQCLIVG
jgi:hypothetical protein